MCFFQQIGPGGGHADIEPGETPPIVQVHGVDSMPQGYPEATEMRSSSDQSENLPELRRLWSVHRCACRCHGVLG